MIRALALNVLLLSPLVMAEVVANPIAERLEAMAEASTSRDYQGRLVYQFGAELSALEVRHAVIDGKSYQRLTHLDGQLVEVVRRGDEVICMHPDRTLTRLEPEQVDPLSLGARLALGLPEYYSLRADGDGRVAGRDTDRLLLVPLDEHRYGYRLWLDKASSLLLKSEVIDRSGVPLERVEFVSLELDPPLSEADFALPEGLLQRARLASQTATEFLHTAVTVVPGWLPAGFAERSSDLRHTGKAQRPVVAQAYSDGLAAFTVFIESVAQRSVEEGLSRVGPTVAISRLLADDGNDYLLTLVGEIPAATADRVLTQMQIVVSEDVRHD